VPALSERAMAPCRSSPPRKERYGAPLAPA
jgi:hypothetical protein